MDRLVKQGFRNPQVAGEKAGEVKRPQFGVTHGGASYGRNPCECDLCGHIASQEIITRTGVMKACPECARLEFGNIRIQIVVHGEREHAHA